VVVGSHSFTVVSALVGVLLLFLLVINSKTIRLIMFPPSDLRGISNIKGWWPYATLFEFIFIYAIYTFIHNSFLTLVRMAFLAPLCRMANTFECPFSASPPADPKLVSEDTNKMSKS
jgi:hypothetical protein